ncbi:MAG TPA: FAD-linked oxidase C-terminal domain-containing protein, partial [Dehalococcoidia bacterium]|nr:FAD-linked oxidase C-terminal domain-containing protein [Dehalococcoidia bacterium]
YIGSLGTLGVIAEATFKLMPLPKAEATLSLAFDAPAAACALAAEAQRRGLSLRAVELLNPTAATAAGLPELRWTLLVGLAGSPAAVERSRREIAELAQPAAVQNAAQLSQAGRSVLAASQLLCRASLLPSKLPALTEALDALDAPPVIVAWPTVGTVWAAWPKTPDPQALVSRSRDAVAGLGGSLVVAVCPPALKPDIDVFPDVSGPSFQLMRRVKEQFDPNGILSPGRFLGRL